MTKEKLKKRKQRNRYKATILGRYVPLHIAMRKRIERIRGWFGLSRMRLARESQVCYNSMNLFLRGDRDFACSTYERLAQVVCFYERLRRHALRAEKDRWKRKQRF